jgi:hypothetical protein
MMGRWPRRRVARGPHGTARARAAAAGEAVLASPAALPGGAGPAGTVAEPGSTGGHQVIALRLEHLRELFDLPETDLFSEGRDNYYLAGLDVALSELRGRPYRPGLVRLEITVPTAEVEPGREATVARAVRRYCEARIAYNRSERRAALAGGAGSLAVGLPVAAAGIIVAAVFRTGIPADVIGAVLTWVGLWYPLDQLLFYPSECTRENRPLRRLRDAEVVLLPRGAAGPGGPSRFAPGSGRSGSREWRPE